MDKLFIVNEFITLKLENGITNIYIKGVLFRQCKYLLLNVPLHYEQNVATIDSIDEAAEVVKEDYISYPPAFPVLSCFFKLFQSSFKTYLNISNHGWTKIIDYLLIFNCFEAS